MTPHRRSLAALLLALPLAKGCASSGLAAGGGAEPTSIVARPAAPSAAGDPAGDEPPPTLSADTAGPVASSVAEPAKPAAVLPAPAPEVRHPFNDPLPVPVFARDAPALRIANLSPQACRAELARRELPTKRAGGVTPGVATPLRLTGQLGGVRFAAPGGKSPYGVLDCRLALLLDELAPVLASHGVTAVRGDNFYRPRAHLPGRRRTPSQHSYGLAIDVTGFVLADGRTLEVERDWPAQIGSPACGPDARTSTPAEAEVALRNLVCDIARQGFFHDVLTPNYDVAHRNHLHLDIKRGVRWSSVR